MRTTLMEQPAVVNQKQQWRSAQTADQQESLATVDKNKVDKTIFANRFADKMPMNADIKTVAQYLDKHPDWFTRCAQPMQVEALSANGYAITIGKFNSFGYVVEPKVGLELMPQHQDIYPIKTIGIPDYQAPGYEVDFDAEMRLVEVVQGQQLMTQIEWNLNLEVAIQFPKFIHKLPPSVIQKTGDNLLKQIVRQVSKRLTQRVQKDFHGQAGLTIPK
jgi:pterin-4a-carbinolamine dehydratase